MELWFPSDVIDYNVEMTSVLFWYLSNLQFSNLLQMGMPKSLHFKKAHIMEATGN
jgi:hypothetical protein